jgi:hypothetical protein
VYTKHLAVAALPLQLLNMDIGALMTTMNQEVNAGEKKSRENTADTDPISFKGCTV